MSRALGFPGKPDGIDGSEVDRYVQEGRISEVAAYAETDVVTTYRLSLVYELFRGTLTRAEFGASELGLLAFLRERLNTKPHLRYLVEHPATNSGESKGSSEARYPAAIHVN